MHVLPADMDRAYRAGELVTSAHDDDAVGSWVQDLRALPCQPAEALIWTGRLLHYGGRSCRRAPTPRISIACAVSQPSFEDPEMRLPGDPSHCIWGVERRGEFSPLGSLAGCFLALGSGLGLVGTASARR